jgi:hypothetical protein
MYAPPPPDRPSSGNTHLRLRIVANPHEQVDWREAVIQAQAGRVRPRPSCRGADVGGAVVPAGGEGVDEDEAAATGGVGGGVTTTGRRSERVSVTSTCAVAGRPGAESFGSFSREVLTSTGTDSGRFAGDARRSARSPPDSGRRYRLGTLTALCRTTALVGVPGRRQRRVARWPGSSRMASTEPSG